MLWLEAVSTARVSAIPTPGADAALVQATRDLVSATGGIVRITAILAAATFLLAIVSAVGVWLQLLEVRRAREEFRAAQRAARPDVVGQATFSAGRPRVATVAVEYIHGSEPAYDVKVRVRWRRDGRQGDVAAFCGTLTPAHSMFKGTLRSIPGGFVWPGEEPPAALADDGYWLGLAWKRTDGQAIALGRVLDVSTEASRWRKDPPDHTSHIPPEVDDEERSPDG
jgi:hypothetical protein